MNKEGKPHGQLCHLLIVCYKQRVILTFPGDKCANVSFLKCILVILSKQLQLTYMVKPLNKKFICIYGFLAELKNSLENKLFVVYVARLMYWENMKTKSSYGIYFCEMFHNDKHTELLLAHEATRVINHSFCRGFFFGWPAFIILLSYRRSCGNNSYDNVNTNLYNDWTRHNNYYYFRSIINLFIYFNNSWVYL